MPNIGWSEILIVAAFALIVVGPKDLPALLRQLGRIFSTVRRMGNEFKSELNKVAAIDEFKEARKSITDPLNQTSKQIADEFNKLADDGSVVPSGKIKPKIEGSESVADEIREAAGLPPAPQPDPEAAANSMKEAVQRGEARAAEAAAKAESAKAAAKAKATAATAKSSAADTAAKPAARTAKKAPAKRKSTSAKTASAATKTSKTSAAKPRAAAKKTTARSTAAKKPVAKKPAAPRKTTKASPAKSKAQSS